ncbi:hypothetical protein DFH09DRAFT_478919 [Mycena vulgaris]|nr:hypothetical protein DFH09DRAFT_478919 [Mycena vulgaris]
MFSSPASSSSSSSSAGSSPMGYSTSSVSSISSSSLSSSSSSTRSSLVHAASLVDPARHPAALLQLVDIKLSRQVIDYVVDCVAETVDHALGRTPTRGRAPTRSPYIPKFTTFVRTVLSRAEVTAPTLLTALVYVFRARPHLSIAIEEWALERVFLGALIAASKYANDSTLKNVHWALCTGVFGKRDVGRIEREFLGVLDWELGVGEADLMAHHAGLAFALAPEPVRAPEPMLLAVPRHTRKTSVPELELSSPQSSAASMSPRTPASSSHSSSHLSSSPPAKELDVPMDVDSHPAAQKSGRFHDLLRSFPLPRSHTHHAHGRSFAIHIAA